MLENRSSKTKGVTRWSFSSSRWWIGGSSNTIILCDVNIFDNPPKVPQKGPVTIMWPDLQCFCKHSPSIPTMRILVLIFLLLFPYHSSPSKNKADLTLATYLGGKTISKALRENLVLLKGSMYEQQIGYTAFLKGFQMHLTPSYFSPIHLKLCSGKYITRVMLNELPSKWLR